MFRDYKKIVTAPTDQISIETESLGFEEPPPAASYEPPPLPKGTIQPYADFTEPHQEEQTQALRTAMKGIGTDELTIIQILTRHNNEQRQELCKTYKTQFGRDLKTDLMSETSGSFKSTIRALLMPSRLYDASCIHDAMDGFTDEIRIIDILVPRSNEEIEQIKTAYTELYKRNLEKDLTSETSGDFKRLLVSIVQANRENGDNVDMAKVKQDSKDLYTAGEAKIGTDEEVFNRILALRSWPHIKAISGEYKKNYGKTLSASVKGEFSGYIRAGLLAIVSYAENPVKHFAERAHDIKGRDDSTLRFLVSHSETDLYEIKQVYHQQYRRTLEYTISKTESGDFARLLIKIINPNLDNSKLHSMCS